MTALYVFSGTIALAVACLCLSAYLDERHADDLNRPGVDDE